ncbi:MAG TPA: Gfo/Idh/MocA family oxidoreductase [Pseudomonadales bacterium]
MKALLIGCSDIARRRVLPAWESCTPITSIAVASKTHAAATQHAHFDDYQQALDTVKPDLVYISLINSLHAHWIQQSLLAGAHVIVDKPACLDHDTALPLVALAQQQQRCLAEATVYTDHPQFGQLRAYIDEHGIAIQHIHATFAFPPFQPGNFRYQPMLGGGALLDLGPYAVSAGRFFYRDTPASVHAVINSHHPDTGVETGFSMLAHYPHGRTFSGHFSFQGEYTNSLELIGPEFHARLQRAFTTPADASTSIAIRHRHQAHAWQINAADSFALFFKRVIADIQNNHHAHWAETLLSDANSMQQLRTACEQKA